MADYRLSAQVISRSTGRSVTSAAAYRAACVIECDRYGDIHDYTRKGGVVHSEIMAPDTAHEWMLDRSLLWNAVERVETHKNAQLAREIQLSLPHELTDEQRRDLVRGFVQEQFVSQGMIADVSIHAPDRRGDQRNYHAHIMLTMRELTGDGFHPKKATAKARSWNDKKTLLPQWREQWAAHQNRTFEALGIDARVDHRSYADQGIDREPTAHKGHRATAMERRGEASRIGDGNHRVRQRNKGRLTLKQLNTLIAEERAAFADWKEAQRAEMQNAQIEGKAELADKHTKERAHVERQLQAQFGDRWKSLQAEAEKYREKLDTKGVRALLRRIFGQQERDLLALKNARAGMMDIKQRASEHRSALKRDQEAEKALFDEQQGRQRDTLETHLDNEQKRKEDELQALRPKSRRKKAPAPELSETQKAALEQTKKKQEQRKLRPKGRGRGRGR